MENSSVSEREKEYENNLKKQLLIFEALGRDYLNICLIHIKSETVTLLKTSFSTAMYENQKSAELSYDFMCGQCIEKYTSDVQKEEMRQRVKLSHVLEELSDKKEYSFIFDTEVKHHMHKCKMKYVSLDDAQHILMAFRIIDETADAEREKNEAVIRQTAEELRKERSFLEVLCRDYTSVYYFDLNQGTLEVLKVDTNANVARLGTQLRQKLDYSAEMKRYCDAYVVEKDREEFAKIMKSEYISEKLQQTDKFTYRYQSMPNDVGNCYFEAQAVRITDEKFDNTAILAFRHIDDIVAAEKQRQQEIRMALEAEERSKWLEAEKENAIAANEMKSRFLSSISHDIRTPVNGIQGMLRIADTYPNDMKKQSECREKMWVASNYLVSLVNNVLNMNRLENKSIDLSEQPFNLIDLLMDITAMSDMQVTAQGLRSVVDWKPGYITHRYLIGSAEGLSRILMNINSNAIKYNKKNGMVYCRCLEKECDGETAWFEFVNADTGIGMKEEFLEHAFDAYSQEKNTSLNSINGVGLGLSIVKQTVELMGGTLKVESKVNEGTKYTIMLPFKIDKAPHKKVQPEKQISLKGVKALLVEDNELNLEIAKFHLEQEDVKVFTAVNGQEAVDMFRNSQVGYYDIILMDIMMPIMNGLEATKCIRSMNRPDALSIPIIAMSANAFEKDIEMSLEAGMNAHLVKPMDGEKISSTMKKYLANRIRQ